MGRISVKKNIIWITFKCRQLNRPHQPTHFTVDEIRNSCEQLSGVQIEWNIHKKYKYMVLRALLK